MSTLLLPLALSAVLDPVPWRLSRRRLGNDASETLWGTTMTRTLAWVLAYRLARR